MIIIHGDDIVSARNHLSNLIEEAKNKSLSVRRLAVDSLDPTSLTQVLEAATLFGDEPLIVIEGLLATVKSKKKENLIEFLKKYQKKNLILFESKEIGVLIKEFPDATVKLHKPAAIIFSFLESLKPGSSPKSLKLLSELEDSGEPAELIFAMLARQIRLLLQALTPSTLRVAPWQKNRLTAQSRAFGEGRLLDLYEKLYRIDKGIKTGANPIDLSTQLFDLIASL